MADNETTNPLTVRIQPECSDIVRPGELNASLSRAGLSGDIPAILVRARADGCYADYFLAQYDNENTRRAYKRIVDRFLEWCDGQGVDLHEITPRMCGMYRDQTKGSPATKKQSLAGLRGFFDLLVERHFCVLNPARSTRNPRESVEQGKTPEIPIKNVERLIASIDSETVVGKRDRAIIAAWAATGARIGAVAKIRLKNLFYNDGQWLLILDEKNAKHREIPVRHDLQRFILDYLLAAQLNDEPGDWHMFRTARGRTSQLQSYESERYADDGTLVSKARGMMKDGDMRRMLKRRLVDAGFGTRETKTTANGHKHTQYRSLYSPHSFRVMVVTDLLEQGNDIHDVAYLVGHSSTRTTQGYDRTRRKVKRNLVERIRVNLDKGE